MGKQGGFCNGHLNGSSGKFKRNPPPPSTSCPFPLDFNHPWFPKDFFCRLPGSGRLEQQEVQLDGGGGRGRKRTMSRKRLECAELAPALVRSAKPKAPACPEPFRGKPRKGSGQAGRTPHAPRQASRQSNREALGVRGPRARAWSVGAWSVETNGDQPPFFLFFSGAGGRGIRWAIQPAPLKNKKNDFLGPAWL